MSDSATTGDLDDAKKSLTIIIAAIGGVIAALVVVVVAIASVVCTRLSSLKKQMDLIQMSLRSMQKDMNQTQQAIERLPKNIVQFPITKTTMTVVDDVDDRAGTEPASPIFYRKGYTPTPLASSLTSVTEVPGGNQMLHHPLQRNNAMLPHRSKQVGPPVPPKRAHSFNTHSFNY